MARIPDTGRAEGASSRRWRGTLFGAGLPAQGSNVRVGLRPASLVLVDAEERETEVGFSALHARAGGWRGDTLLLEWRDGDAARSLALQEERGAVEEFLRAAPEALRRRLEPWRRAYGGAARRRRAWLLAGGIAIATVAAFAVALVTLSERLVGAAVARIPAAWEARLGEQVAAQMLREARIRTSGPAHRALEDMGARLAAHAQAPYAFRWLLVDDAQVNAMAIPGGTVVVFTGLVRFTETPEEFAGVLAHEVQHVVRRHSMRALVRSLGWRVTLGILFGGSGELGAQVGALAERLGDLRFSRQQESEADAEGVRLLERAGIRADGMARFFERLAREANGVPAFLSTHPASAERARRIRDAAGGAPIAAPLPYDWDAVRAELAAPAAR